MKVAVIGNRGQLGMELGLRLGKAALLFDKDEMDITCRESVLETLAACGPDAVINAAAYTDVDGAEIQSEVCFAINAQAVAHLVEACSHLGCPLVQISTDYVFGTSAPRIVPYREEESTSPQGFYAKSKLEGERHAATHRQHFIVRTCGLYGRPGPNTKKNNFIDTMISLGQHRKHLRVVNDQLCTPTYVPHLARAVLFLLEGSPYGTYHITNRGSTNWAELASEVFEQQGMNVEIEPISTEAYGSPAPRPKYSVLDTGKYHALGGPEMPTWREAVAEYLTSDHISTSASK